MELTFGQMAKGYLPYAVVVGQMKEMSRTATLRLERPQGGRPRGFCPPQARCRSRARRHTVFAWGGAPLDSLQRGGEARASPLTSHDGVPSGFARRTPSAKATDAPRTVLVT